MVRSIQSARSQHSMTTIALEPAATTTFTMRKTTSRSPWSRAGGSQCRRRRSRQRHPRLRRLHPRFGERQWRLRRMRECRSFWRVRRGLIATEPPFAVERRVGLVWVCGKIVFLKGLKIKGRKRKSTYTREPEEKNLGWYQRKEREREREERVAEARRRRKGFTKLKP